VNHGTNSTYRNYRCRCPQCVAAHAANAAAYRARQREARAAVTPTRPAPQPRPREWGAWSFDIQAAIDRAVDAAVPQSTGYKHRDGVLA
jgi:hypothetical protein